MGAVNIKPLISRQDFCTPPKKLKLVMKTLLVVLVCLSNLNLSAQITSPEKDSSSVTVHKDPRIDLLVKKQAEVNKKTGGGGTGKDDNKGFRLMVLVSTNRDDANKARTLLYTTFPELKNYFTFQSPYYKVKAGNFQERTEADKYRRKLNIYFPRGVFIMPDIIEIKEKDRKDKEEDNKKR
jgi:SPOR domain